MDVTLDMIFFTLAGVVLFTLGFAVGINVGRQVERRDRAYGERCEYCDKPGIWTLPGVGTRLCSDHYFDRTAERT
jgi:hypothetical protein